MKVCSSCHVKKPEEEFPPKRKNSGNGRCKECCRDYGKQHYKNNKRLYLSRNKRTVDRRRDWYNELKTRPCADCGNTFPPCVMEFDHRDGEEKLYTVSFLVTRRIVAKKTMLAEIAKCDLVCANCHRLRTCKRNHKHHAPKA